jgi:nucleoside-diphosphate-sugar epimerase
LRILLTGADGFTGRHLEQRARAAGHEVLPLAADLRDAAAVRQALQGVQADAVVHLAAIAFVAHEDERAFYDVNLFGTLNLLAALREGGALPRRIVLASSANVYGNAERSPIPESQPPAPVNHYAMSKLAMEHLAAAKADAASLVVIRPFNYTGPGQSPDFVIPKLVDHFRRRAPEIRLGNIDVEREYNDVRFTCEAILGLLREQAPVGTYNICTGVPHSLAEVIALLERLTGHHPRITTDPALVRPHEIRRLCGDPSRLRSACPSLPEFTLQDTLAWMLEAAPQ